MPVNTPRKEYAAYRERWERARAAAAGSDAVKALRTKILPMLDSHKTEAGGVVGVNTGQGSRGDQLMGTKYDAYLQRALYYNATGRTADGLAGAIFQKDPKVEKVSKDVKEQLDDVTLTGVSLPLFGLEATYDVLVVGRYGILIDMPEEDKSTPEDARPYWAAYEAENIISWTTERREGKMMLTRVVLKENRELVNEKDAFEQRTQDVYRVLALEDKKYTVTVHAPAGPTNEALVAGETITPLRRGKPLPAIPFVFIGPCSTSPEIEKAPLSDLIDVNLSHFQTMADLEHGLHHVGVPQLVISGAADDGNGPISFGSGVAIMLPQGGDAKILQADGEMMGALERADERKRKMMATLGARLLEDQPSGAETATAFLGRHSGEQASLRTVAVSVEKALTQALRWHAWWAGSAGDSPADMESVVDLNKDFFAVKMSPQELQTWVMALQSGAVAYETFYNALEQGELTRPGVDATEEQKDIEAFGAASAGVMGGGGDQFPPAGENLPPTGPGIQQGDQVTYDSGPYKIVMRGGKHLVIKADSGKVMGTHPSHKAALAQLAALEIALKKEKK